MGADFMLYCCEAPADYKRAMPLIQHRIRSLSDNQLDGIGDDCLWYYTQEIIDEAQAECTLKEEDLWKLNDLTFIKIRSMIREKIETAADELFGDSYRRDVATIHLHGRIYLMTGGMSWGDLPTEACDIINLISFSGITDGMSDPDFNYETFKA